jgi:hypothetical protein
MLQLSVAGTRDYELRIPTRIRSIVINNAAGTDDGQITVRSCLCLHPPKPYHVCLMPMSQATLQDRLCCGISLPPWLVVFLT